MDKTDNTSHPVTSHAIARYQERVRAPSGQPVSAGEAFKALSCRAVQIAIRVGAPFVKLGGGQRIVIRRGCAITVLPAHFHPRGLRRERDHLHV